jgi:CheY-like chemotaxis protein
MSPPVDILLVEDNAHDIELTLHALKHNGVAEKIRVVRDGEEALDFIFAKDAYADRKDEPCPRLILLDLKLPKVSGLEVLKALKEDLHTRVIPVVILSASREEQDVLLSYQLGVNSYIVKPVDFEKFSEVIRQLGLYWLMLNEPVT